MSTARFRCPARYRGDANLRLSDRYHPNPVRELTLDPVAANTSGFLYRSPELYDSIYRYDETAIRLTRLCHEQLVRNGKNPPSSVLDLGCGTAYKLAYLHEIGYQCTGIDYVEATVSHARREHPGIRFEAGDIRDVRIDQKYDVILCLGWVLENVHSCADISRVMATFAVHANPGALLVLGTHNPIGDLAALGAKSSFTIEREDFRATGHASFTVNRRHQILTRHLTWSLPGDATEEEVTRYRLFFPMELEFYLTSYGFGNVEMFDNMDLASSNLEGSMLYVTATSQG
ncbi:class I SAM-dependent methyltransferase [Micromonospora sp. LOL_015]|uniref:class I SAM-dependent methyltransferase n=1 Tax=Micromonospora sp. LOL_015 TaxID=3345416 RepID=UPI003A8A2C9F